MVAAVCCCRRQVWPMIAPCFRVTAVDDTGVEHEGRPGNGTASAGTETERRNMSPAHTSHVVDTY